ncbi:SGNH/GDSL hydrolase family protein [Leifsonia aquatica]|uniref:SGNH/GDSL hydrolase family protein n=1 Tax=Leifsonia aquatica TaxID=144185 RepID=UPI003810FE30
MRSLPRLSVARVLGVVGLCVLTVVTVVLSGFAIRSSHTVHEEGTTWPVLQAVDHQPIAVFLGGSESVAEAGHASWPSLVSQARGWQQVNLSHADTGYLTAGTCGAAPCPNFLEAVPEVVALAPSIVVVSGGWNETASDTDVSVQVANTFQALHQGLPDATIIAVGPATADATPSASVLNTDSAVKTAATTLGLTYVSLLDPPALNASMFSDGRLNDAGQAAIAARVAAAVK